MLVAFIVLYDSLLHTGGILQQGGAAAHGSHGCFLILACPGLCPVKITEDDGVAVPDEMGTQFFGILLYQVGNCLAVIYCHICVQNKVYGVGDKYGLEDTLVAAGTLMAQDILPVGASGAGKGVINIVIGQCPVFVLDRCSFVRYVVQDAASLAESTLGVGQWRFFYTIVRLYNLLGGIGIQFLGVCEVLLLSGPLVQFGGYQGGR